MYQLRKQKNKANRIKDFYEDEVHLEYYNMYICRQQARKNNLPTKEVSSKLRKVFFVGLMVIPD